MSNRKARQSYSHVRRDTTAEDPDFAVLEIYFIWADEMRERFQDPPSVEGDVRGVPAAAIVQGVYLRTWWGALNAVIEGWRKLKLSDPAIDALLGEHEYVTLLRRARNEVFHFPSPSPKSGVANLIETRGAFMWANQLHEALRVFFFENR